jgi:hypothetical protein
MIKLTIHNVGRKNSEDEQQLDDEMVHCEEDEEVTIDSDEKDEKE